MKINEVTPQLRITPTHKLQARSSKHQLIVNMDPRDFLKATTPDQEAYDEIISKALSTVKYNRFAKSGENILMPFLAISLDHERIQGHEGRHRAASLINKGGTKMPVAIKMIPGEDAYKKYADAYDPTYNLKFEDFPNMVIGQYGQGYINKRKLEVVIDGWNNM